MNSPTVPELLEDVFTAESVLRTTLANGLRVLVRQVTSAPVVSIVTYVRAGYLDELNEVVGIAHVLEHMFFKGTSARGVGEIARETKASGGYLNAGTIYDHTHYYTVLPSNGFAAGLAVQADAYANSAIDAGELKKELEVIIEEVKRKSDNAGAVSTEKLFALLHDRHRIRRWRMGREGALRELSATQVLQFYRNYYRPSNTVLAVVGDVDPADALELIKRLYGRIPDAEVVRSPGPEEPQPIVPAFRYADMAGDIQQTELQFGWRAPPVLDGDAPALDVLAAVLANGRASRLYRAVRERRLASSVTAYNYTLADLGVFVVHATARPEDAGSAARAIWDEIRRARDGEVTEVELERARRVVHAQWLRRMETMIGQAEHLASWELLGDWRLGSQYLDGMLGTGAIRLAQVASRYLTPERAGLVVYRPSHSVALARNAAEMRASLDAAPTEALSELTRPRRPSPVPGSRAWSLEREEEQVFVFRTSAGIPVLIQRRVGSIAHFGWFVRGGAVYEASNEAGLTTLMTRTSLKGTERRTAQRIAEDAEFLGGVLTTATGADGFQWTMSVPVHRLDDAMELLADVVQRPLFSEDALELERTVALANLASLRDDMYHWPLRLAMEAAWAGHPYGQSVLGTEHSLSAIRASAVRRWHERCAIEAPGVLVLVADVDPEEGAGLAARYFGVLRAVERPLVPPPVWPHAMVERVEKRDKAQSALAMLFPGPSRTDDSRFATSLIAGVASGLGGRFFDELRDRQSLAYTVLASPIVRQRSGAFSAYIAMSPEKEESARRGLLAEFAKLCDGPVSDRELTLAKTYALGSRSIRREGAAHVLSDIADAWLYGRALRELSEYEQRVRAVTAHEMLGVARQFFEPGRRVEGVVRSAGPMG